MIKKEITIAGKQVTLAYCYATEMAYKELSNEDILTIVKEIAESFTKQDKDPDAKKCINLIAASIISYYESEKQEPPIEVTDLMYKVSPTDMVLALTTILTMRAEFYGIPLGEPEDKPAKGGKKKKNS